MKKYIYGFDIGGTTVKIGLFNIAGDLILKSNIKTNLKDKGKHILLEVFNEIKTHKIDQSEVLGYGFGVPGPVYNGIIIKCVNIGWENYDIKAEFSKYTNNPSVFVENDAKVALFGETWKGAAKGYINSAMLTIGTGIGSGIISDGKMIYGADGSAGEIGHVQVIHEDGIICNCGSKGCLETVASATGIKNEYIKTLREDNLTPKSRQASKSAKKIFDLAKRGDITALKVVDKVAYYLGYACHILSVTTNPNVIIIGGGVSKAGDFLVNKIDDNFRKLLYAPTKNTKIVLSELGNESGIYGAASLVLAND